MLRRPLILVWVEQILHFNSKMFMGFVKDVTKCSVKTVVVMQ